VSVCICVYVCLFLCAMRVMGRMLCSKVSFILMKLGYTYITTGGCLTSFPSLTVISWLFGSSLNDSRGVFIN